MKLEVSPGYGPGARYVMILAHGAGAPMDSPFMAELAGALDARQIACVRFEFPYMEKRRADGKKRPPDRQPRLLERFRAVIEQVRADLGEGVKIVIGGKSMGGRMASLLATEADLALFAVVGYGYPFHPPGKLDRWRTDHFCQLACPFLVVQGTRDPFGKQAEVAERELFSGLRRIVWLEGGDHDYQPLKRQPETQRALIARSAEATRQFLEDIAR